MVNEKLKVANITLISKGKNPGIAEVACPDCGFVNSFKVKSYLGEAGVEPGRECSQCGATIAFFWELEVRKG